MSVTRRTAAGAEGASIEPPGITVPDRWQVSRYFPIQGLPDDHGLAIGWSRVRAKEWRYT
jgi:hypothetical protein